MATNINNYFLPSKPSSHYLIDPPEIHFNWRGVNLPKEILQILAPEYTLVNIYKYQSLWKPQHALSSCLPLYMKIRSLCTYKQSTFPHQWTNAGYATLMFSFREDTSMDHLLCHPLHVFAASTPTCKDVLAYLQTYFDSTEQNVVMVLSDIQSPYAATIRITPPPEIYFPRIKSSDRELFFADWTRMLHITPMGINIMAANEQFSTSYFCQYKPHTHQELYMERTNQYNPLDWENACRKQYKTCFLDLIQEFQSRIACGLTQGNDDEGNDDEGNDDEGNDDHVNDDNYYDEKNDDNYYDENGDAVSVYKDKYSAYNALLDKEWIQEDKWSMLPELTKHNPIYALSTCCHAPLQFFPARDIRKVWVDREFRNIFIIIEKTDHECIFLTNDIIGFFLHSDETIQRLEADGVLVTNRRKIEFPYGKRRTVRDVTNNQVIASRCYYSLGSL